MVWMVATAAVMVGRKRPYEIVQRLQRVAGATDVPLSCGEGIPYTHALRYSLCMLTKVCFQMSFSIAVCVWLWVCVCVWFNVGSKRGRWHWEKLRSNIPYCKSVTLQSSRQWLRATVETKLQVKVRRWAEEFCCWPVFCFDVSVFFLQVEGMSLKAAVVSEANPPKKTQTLLAMSGNTELTGKISFSPVYQNQKNHSTWAFF